MENDKRYCVYMHICPNKKKYIGVTSIKNPVYRWGKGGAFYFGQRFKEAIEKFGWDNIQHLILFNNLSKETAGKKERELIQKYNSTNPEHGYNVGLGGFGKGKHSEETKEKIRIAMKKDQKAIERMRYYAKNKTPEAIEKIRKAATGVKQSKETIEKRADKLRGKRKTKTTIEKMVAAQTNRNWEENRLDIVKEKLSKRIIQYSLNGEIIQEWESISEAGRQTGINFSKISACCRGVRKSTGGYRWKFKEKEMAI